ncbi:hypothetical protein TNCV_1065211 [Trichonephila clavipes]|nr:hypothetical protein TNCV_1065211 [Trichonephila clavipes]
MHALVNRRNYSSDKHLGYQNMKRSRAGRTITHFPLITLSHSELIIQIHTHQTQLTSTSHLIGRAPRQTNYDKREPLLGNPSVQHPLGPGRSLLGLTHRKSTNIQETH